MTIRAGLIGAACCVLFAAGPAVQRVPDLWIDAAVVDRDGAPVRGLGPQEFEVWIGGYRIPLLEAVPVTPAERGRTVVLLLDDLATPPQLVPRIREAAMGFLDRMQTGDRVALVPLHGEATELTADRARLKRQLDAFRARGVPFRIEDAGEHVMRTFISVARRLAEGPRGRNVVVGIGAGWLFDRPIVPQAASDLRGLWIEAMRAAGPAHAVLYVIDPAGLESPSGRLGGASGFAGETGGYAFMATNDLRGAAGRIWQEAGTYYLLGLADPPLRRTAELRELEVRVRRAGLTVRSRRAVPGPVSPGPEPRTPNPEPD